MTSRGRHRFAASVLMALVSTACGGGGGVKQSLRPRAPEPRLQPVVPRSVQPAPTLAPHGQPVVPPRVQSVPKSTPGGAPPAIVDRGADNLAIGRSLVGYGRWLEWHHPDPALVGRAYARGTALARDITDAVSKLARAHEHIVEVDRAPLDFVVVSVLSDVVSFRVTEHLGHRDLVDASGRVLQHVGPVTEHYVILMTRFGSDTWRLNAVDREGAAVEVQL